jgi:hypothetical protein
MTSYRRSRGYRSRRANYENSSGKNLGLNIAIRIGQHSVICQELAGLAYGMQDSRVVATAKILADILQAESRKFSSKENSQTTSANNMGPTTSTTQLREFERKSTANRFGDKGKTGTMVD